MKRSGSQRLRRLGRHSVMRAGTLAGKLQATENGMSIAVLALMTLVPIADVVGPGGLGFESPNSGVPGPGGLGFLFP